MIDGQVTVDFAATVVFYAGNNYQRCENFVSLIEVFCQFLESRRGIGETRITDIIEVLRGASGWPYGQGDDEVTHAWNLLYLLIAFPVDTTPIKVSCGTIEEQIRMIFPPAPLHATPLKFKTTLSDILKAGLKVKPAVYFLEHLQIERDGDDLTVRLMRTSPSDVGFYKSYIYNRAAKFLPQFQCSRTLRKGLYRWKDGYRKL
ncbi:hypothetical protein BD410DRAFT_531567 [Rickenella mellea]|uniref:Uncharacterized protein n=1 Tax=Rickenella mellea TaxID=50990 RepID=A0A4Y7QGC3_9AGAM|nr:hypothetical protein BD410DRAFT_531567 [Rickenella mellea]